MIARVFSDTVCTPGEGVFRHPERSQFLWFDILEKRLLAREGDEEQVREFGEYVSAAGWVDRDTLIMASASALWRFDIESDKRVRLVVFDADNSVMRSNHGRADPYGEFWIGTMGYNAEPGAGAIYRYYCGALHKPIDQLSTSNAVCFSPEGSTAYFTDTKDGRVVQRPLDAEGRPSGDPEVFLDLRDEEFGTAGAFIDPQGNFRNAQWGASRIACHTPNGKLIETRSVPTSQASCPCFGGTDLSTLFVITATDGLKRDDMAGKPFAVETNATGQPEHRVNL